MITFFLQEQSVLARHAGSDCHTCWYWLRRLNTSRVDTGDLEFHSKARFAAMAAGPYTQSWLCSCVCDVYVCIPDCTGILISSVSSIMVPLHPPVPPHLSVAETLEQAGSWNRTKWAVVQTETICPGAAYPQHSLSDVKNTDSVLLKLTAGVLKHFLSCI